MFWIVKNSVVTSKLYQVHTSSGLNLVQLSSYEVQRDRARGRGREERILKER